MVVASFVLGLVFCSLTAAVDNSVGPVGDSASRILQYPLEMGFKGKLDKSTIFSHNKTVVCMLDSWSHWRNDEGSFDISNIDPSLCSQIVYRNVAINNITFEILLRDEHLDKGMKWLQNTVALGQQFQHLKVLLSVGGWIEGSKTFSKIAADHKKRKTFIDSVLRILDDYHFHGLDMAWEYPTWNITGGVPSDRDHFPLLLKDLREAFSDRYFLSVTCPGDRFLAEKAYNMHAVEQFVDQFNLRPFDFAGLWDNKAYHHAALQDSGSAQQSVQSTVKFYMESGVPPHKIVVGVPAFGRKFLLKDLPVKSGGLNNASLDMRNFSGLGAPILKYQGFKGKWIPDESVLGYHEMCYFLTKSEDEWLTFWDNFCNAPFARSGKRWVSFDNPESIEAKAQLVVERQLKGMMLWTIDTDDFRGTACRKNNEDEPITFPLLRTVNYAFAQPGNDYGIRFEVVADSTETSHGGNNEHKGDKHDNKPHSTGNKAKAKSSAENFMRSGTIHFLLALCTLVKLF